MRELTQQWGLEVAWRMEKGSLSKLGQEAAVVARYHSAYGHSRFRELLLGSPTDRMLSNNKIPTFLSA